MGTKVIRGKGESIEQLMRRFRSACEKGGVMRDMRKKTFFVSEAEQRREKQRRSDRRIKLSR